ncbi:MAG: UbiD family decarboxylase [Planctomycetota bacterium]|nr:MAG: UbiD family decarboxylase [Planctomycetota bacterium]
MEGRSSPGGRPPEVRREALSRRQSAPRTGDGIMAHEHLSDFVAELDAAGEVCRVPAEVEDDELAAVAHQEALGRRPACLVFERRPSGRLPAVTHLLATPERLWRALGCSHAAELPERVASLLPLPPANDWRAVWSWVPVLCSAWQSPPERTDSAVVQQVVRLGRDVDLGDFGFPRLWPDDGHGVISGGLILVGTPREESKTAGAGTTIESPGTDERPAERSGSQPAPLITWDVCPVLEHDVVGVPVNPHGPLAGILDEARRRQQSVPVVITLGGDPSLYVVAVAASAFQTDPWHLAGVVRGEPLRIAAARTVPLDVPADAEIVLEGFIDPTRSPESIGTVTDLDGMASDARRYARLRLTAVTYRSNPTLPLSLGIRPPNERSCVLSAAERIWLPLVRQQLPDVTDLHFSPDARGRHVFVAVRRRSAMQVRRVCHALWGFGPTHACTLTVVLDAETELRDPNDVWNRVAAFVDWDRDVTVARGPGSGWPGENPGADGAADEDMAPGRIAVDATAKPGRRAGFARRPDQALRNAAALLANLKSGTRNPP